MIVITAKSEPGYLRCIMPGDELVLKHSRTIDMIKPFTDPEVVLSKKIKKAGTIDYYCVFQFAKDDGTCVSPHLAGFFGNKRELPDEIKNAIWIDDLKPTQYKNFVLSCTMSID